MPAGLTPKTLPVGYGGSLQYGIWMSGREMFSVWYIYMVYMSCIQKQDKSPQDRAWQAGVVNYYT